MSQKRNRSVNWDEEEKQLLRDVLKEYAYIIENKSLKTNTNKAKIKAWEEVHKKFNEVNNRIRELSQLQIQWKTMKLSAKKNSSLFSRESSKTEGEPPSPTNDDADSLNPTELMITDYNSYDSDGIFNATVDDDVTKQKVIKLISEPDVLAIRNDSVNKENNINITSSTIKRHLPTMDQNYTTELLNHSKKLKEIELQRRMEMAEEEHSLKMRTMQENFKSAVLEREILEIKKTLEERKLMTHGDSIGKVFIKNENNNS